MYQSLNDSVARGATESQGVYVRSLNNVFKGYRENASSLIHLDRKQHSVLL
jgi:hypothetical protein